MIVTPTNAMARLLSRFIELHEKLPKDQQDVILMTSAQMVIDLTENIAISEPLEPEHVNIMFELWCTRKNFSIERYKHPLKETISYKDSKTRRAWYAVRDLIEVITQAQERLLKNEKRTDS